MSNRKMIVTHNGVDYEGEVWNVSDTFLGVEDHGIFTAYLHLSQPGLGTSTGGYALDTYDHERKCRVGSAYGMKFIMSVLNVVGVSSWEALKGKDVIVLREQVGYRSVVGLAHILDEDRVFIY